MFTAQLVTGFAELLAADTGFTWALSGEYDPADTGIGVLRFPLGCDRAAAISPYPLTAHPTLAKSEIGIQVKTRAAGPDPFAVMAMDDEVQDALLGRYPLLLPTGIRVASLVWRSGGSLGIDDNDRAMWVSNFNANVARPGTHRI